MRHLRHFLEQGQGSAGDGATVDTSQRPKADRDIYTHIMLDGKAEALAKLPTIAPLCRAAATTARTGTDDIRFAGENGAVEKVAAADKCGKIIVSEN